MGKGGTRLDVRNDIKLELIAYDASPSKPRWPSDGTDRQRQKKWVRRAVDLPRLGVTPMPPLSSFPQIATSWGKRTGWT
jgi:hypothetical protein